MKGNKTFVRITNKDIFEKLCTVEKHVIETNGTVKSHSVSIKTLWKVVLILLTAAVGTGGYAIFG